RGSAGAETDGTAEFDAKYMLPRAEDLREGLSAIVSDCDGLAVERQAGEKTAARVERNFCPVLRMEGCDLDGSAQRESLAADGEFVVRIAERVRHHFTGGVDRRVRF